MSEKNRIAVVKYSPYGKEYLAGCSMKGVNVGDLVVVRDSKDLLHEVEVVSIQWETWVCRNHVVGHADEERFGFDLDSLRSTMNEQAQPSGLYLVS